MIKRSLILTLTLICVLIVGVALVACSERACEEGTCVWEDQEVTLEPTCTTEGSVHQRCSVCYQERDNVIPALGHDFQVEPGSYIAPTCTEKGYTGTSSCTREGCTEIQYGTPIPAVGHSYGEWTSLGNGTHKRVCSTNSAHEEIVNCAGGTATCTDKAICSSCGGQYGETALHVYDQTVATTDYIDVSATCTSKATYFYSCSCGAKGDSTFEFGAFAQHTSTYHEAVDATCSASGNVAYWACSSCYNCYDAEQNGNVIEDVTTPINADAHDWDNGTVTDSATCTTEGVMTYTCNHNGTHTKTEPIAKIAHEFENPVYVIVDNELKIKTTCYCSEEDFADVDSTEPLEIATESDLVTVLTAGYDVVLTDDIVLSNGSIDIDKDVAINLNGHNVSSYTNKQSSTTGYWVCDVFIVRGVTLTITGEGKLYANNDEADSVCVISALDGATVNIYGGEYVSAGCTTLYARTESVINIYGGKVEAEVDYFGVYYTLDINDAEEVGVWGKINVYGGEFVTFNPANHTNDSSYTNKVVDGYHSIYDEETDIYTVSEHVFDRNVTPFDEAQHTSECECGATIKEDHTPYNKEGQCDDCKAQLVTITTYSYTFEAKQFRGNETVALGDVEWTTSGDGEYWGYNSTKGQQFGKEVAPYTTLNLESTIFTNVSEIVINASGASGIGGTLSIYVGDVQVGEVITLTATATAYTVELDSALTGEITFVFSQSSSKAFYVKSIEITYAV